MEVSIMKKLKVVLLAGTAAGAMGLGLTAGAHHSKPVDVKAATETTVYYAVSSATVGSYTVKLNVNFRGDGDDWHSFSMTKTSDSFDTKDVYSCTYTDSYDGVGCMQIQLYDGDTWISQQQPFGIWTPVEDYNGRIYLHDTGWFDYTPGVEKHMPMTTAFFTNWDGNAGTFADTNARFWGENYSFEQLDTFYRGEAAEGWTGTLTSRTWQQSTQYVYFQLGGARDYDHPEGAAHLVFHYGSYSADFYNNTFVENPMTLRYFKIPDEQYAALKALGDDFTMSVDVVDPCTAGYGFVNLGYFHANQTEESTSDAMRYFLNHMSNDSREWEVNKRKEIMNTYFDNADQRSVFFRTVSNIDDSFSTNSDFVNHWYFDHNFFNNDYGVERHFDKAIGTDSYRPDDNYSNMPFNNDGGFFRGWYEGGLNSGFVASDGLRYRFVSRPFVLSGTGLISIKMAGKASLHVIDPSVKNTDAQPADLAWIDNKGFSDGGDMTNLESGFNTATMVRHVINLEAYIGKTIQLAICDYDTSGWSAAYFDSLVSNYSSYPGYRIECPVQSNNGGTHYPVYRDIYINSACKNDGNQFGVIYNGGNAVNTANDNAILNHSDSSDSFGAHNVWKSYLDVVRGGNAGNNYCSSLVSDDIKGVLNAFNGLSNGAKQIVCASDDFERVSGTPVVYGPAHSYNISRILEYLGQVNGINVNTSGSEHFLLNLSNVDNHSTMTIILIICLASISALTMLLVLKKKRSGIE